MHNEGLKGGSLCNLYQILVLFEMGSTGGLDTMERNALPGLDRSMVC